LVTLPIISLLPSLVANDVITMEEKKRIELKQKNELDGMNYFLSEIIIPSLQLKTTYKYKGFLVTMEEHDDTLLNTIAKKLGRQ